MTAFESCFLFLRNPRGGVEDLDAMKAAGFAGVFCNIGDFPPSDWEAVVRPRALAAGMVCGPWLRTQAPDGSFDYGKANFLLDTAERWASPLIVNAESELKGTGGAVTSWLAEELQGRDAAVSVEYWPFDNVYWVPLADVPVLPQVFPEAGRTDVGPAVDAWHSYGVKCVYATFASYGGRVPSDYRLQAPYSLYTADDCGGGIAGWGPTSEGFSGCLGGSEGHPDNGGGSGSVELIGPQHGIDAAVDRLISLDPSGSKPNRDPDDIATWGAYDKLRRTLKILAADHDAARGVQTSDGDAAEV